MWTARSKELEEDEAELHATMSPEIAMILKPKRLLLFGEMLRKIEFPRAAELIRYMADGFPIVGQFPVTDVLPEGYRAETFDTTDLMNTAEETRKMVIATCRATDDTDLDEERRNWIGHRDGLAAGGLD